jgi:hypothetical protein
MNSRLAPTPGPGMQQRILDEFGIQLGSCLGIDENGFVAEGSGGEAGVARITLVAHTTRTQVERILGGGSAASNRLTAADAGVSGQGICRTCLLPIWNEGGSIHHERQDTGWSDRVDKDSLVCFQARDYRHVPLEGREAHIYDVALGRDITGITAGRALIEADLRSRSAFR